MSTIPQNADLPAAPRLEEETLAWLALTLAPGLGPKRILDAMAGLESASEIFRLPLTALEALRFPAEAAQFVFDGKARQAAEEEAARVATQGATLVSLRLPGISGAPERNLRPAAGAVGARTSPLARPAFHRDCWHEASFALWIGHGRDAGAGPGGAAAAGGERNGARD